MSQCLITVELTGQLQHHLQQEQLCLECGQNPTLAGVLFALTTHSPKTAEILGTEVALPEQQTALPPGLLIMRDGLMLPLQPGTPVSDGDRLTLIPMISGG
ncbi:MAG: MoaD/ThiS family protein [Planctomycetaceae bacterium]